MIEEKKVEITNQEAENELKKGYKKAEEIIKDEDKFKEFLLQLEEKLKVVPKFGEKISEVAVLAQLIYDYAKGKYKKIPMGSLIAIVSALSYFILPFDMVPDAIPGIGMIDDAFVITACLKLVDSDVKDYLKWRDTIKIG